MILVQSSKLHNTRLFKRVAGTLRAPDGSMVRAAFNGQADIYGWVGPRHVEIECKFGADKLKKEQQAWRDLCHKHQVAYHVAHADKDDTIQDAALRASSWLESIQQPAGEPGC